MELEDHPIPAWIVMSAGTGGTSSTIGRFIRYKKYPARLCVAARVWSRVFSGVIDEMHRTPDAASIATMYWLEQRLGRKVGPSTSTNLYGILQIAREMQQRGERGSIVTLLCDSGERYLETYCNPDWVQRQIGDCGVYQQELANSL